MFILSYRDWEHCENLGVFLDRDDSRARAEKELRKILSEEGTVSGEFYLEEVLEDGSLRNPVEFVVELDEGEYEFLVDRFNAIREEFRARFAEAHDDLDPNFAMGA